MQKNQKHLNRISVLLLSAIAMDAGYLYSVARTMNGNVALALEKYHTVPIMAEHILAALTLYLICMTLIQTFSKG